METKTQEKPESASIFYKGKNKGRWKLERLIDESQVEKFSLFTLDAYVHPTLNVKYFPSHQGRPMTNFVVDKIITRFDPDAEPTQRKLIDWLICHPQVRVDGLDLDGEILNKKTKAEFSLVNIDQQDLSEIEDNNVIDEIVGRLSFDGGPHAVGIEKMRYVAAQIGVSYIDRRYVNNPKTEKLQLRKKLKSYARNGKKHAEKIKEILTNVDNAKRIFALKVLLDKKDVIYEHGIFKYQGELLGSTLESCAEKLAQVPEKEAEIVDKAKEYIKAEGFKI